MLPGAGTFEPQRNVIRTRYGVGAGSSIAADDKGNVYIFWHAGARGMASLSGPGIRRVYVARSGDEGKTFAQENALFEKPRAFGACICCTLRAGVDAQGQVYVVFRGATATDRNSYLVVSRNHASSFVLVLTHPMPTRARACPESRAAIAIGDGGVYAAWRTKRKVYVSHLESGTSKASWTASAPESTQFQKSPSLATNARGE